MKLPDVQIKKPRELRLVSVRNQEMEHHYE